MLFSQLAGKAPFDKPGAWDSPEANAEIGGSDYGKPIDLSMYKTIKDDQCSKRRTKCDWTVVGPVTARSPRWEFK
eukprot:CAMPEP_0173396502 /NCGR_PEP_ID=MMETSP1356-20130122/35680_1 /TAXON_ID=77927 ORGANISM="Hemiselmis virescens, Strain PCC157" /NCGR_SAMPLE_ID=MMETSP1356 /ASSEMBLY_ACC=CAM_ASM_000847 /LENGTH=74 /DNA_ID=CAMNT_0014355559 /DNA_START=131 /DNA_END=355 /DNA_ORIENTATION=-